MEFWKDKIVEPMAVIGEVLDPIIENALKKKGEEKAVGDNLEGETLLSYMVKLTDGKHYFLFSLSLSSLSLTPYASQDPKIIRDETLNIIIAGRDTVRSTCRMDLSY